MDQTNQHPKNLTRQPKIKRAILSILFITFKAKGVGIKGLWFNCKSFLNKNRLHMTQNPFPCNNINCVHFPQVDWPQPDKDGRVNRDW